MRCDIMIKHGRFMLISITGVNYNCLTLAAQYIGIFLKGIECEGLNSKHSGKGMQSGHELSFSDHRNSHQSKDLLFSENKFHWN